MNFLNDKKNLPIIIAVAAVVIIGAVVGGLFAAGIIGQPPPPAAISPSTAPSSASYPGAPGQTGPGMAPAGAPGMGHPQAMGGAPGMAPGRPGMMPGAPMGAPGGIRTASGQLPNVAAGGPSAGERRPGAVVAGKAHGKVIGRRPGAPVGAPGMPAAPGMPGAGVPGAPGGTAVASASGTSTAVVFQGDPTVGPDPFYTKQPPKIPQHFNPLGPDTESPLLGGDGPLPPIPTTTIMPVPVNGVTGTDPNGTVDAPVVNDQLRRVSGILHSTDGVYAVLETNGVSQTVQPGDDVGGAKVTGIDNDGVTLKTDDNVVLHVPLSDTASVVSK